MSDVNNSLELIMSELESVSQDDVKEMESIKEIMELSKELESYVEYDETLYFSGT